MQNRKLSLNLVRIPALSFAFVLLCFLPSAQAQITHKPSQATPVPTVSATDENPTATREELMGLLRMTPTLTTVISRDPSLLSDREYVSRNNPELEQFLESHPAVVRNPEFYLFANLPGSGKRNRGQALERELWPVLSGPENRGPQDLVIFLVFISILSALTWLVRALLEHRRWSKVLQLQLDTHNKLMERLSGSDQFLNYINSDAGRRFLETASTPVTVSNPIARVLTPLQFGIVLTLVGSGSLLLRRSVPEAQSALLVFGMLVLMLGLGLIISSAISFALALHLGLFARKFPGEAEGNAMHDAKSQS